MRTSHNERLTPDIADAAASPISASERRCILTGEVRAREDLVRLALAPDGAVLPDPGAKAPGRGAWIVPDRARVEAAIADGHFKRALMRAFKGGPEGAMISFADDLPERIEAALRRHLLDRLGLELRGGNIVLGSSRIEEQARAGLVALLAHASDASEGSRRKLDQAWRVGLEREGSGLMGLVLPLDRAALSVALGRDNVVHLGVLGARRPRKGAPDAAARVALATMRLARFCGSDPALPAFDLAGEASARAGGDTDNT